ncbi:hypothetical protein HX017_13095 [Myroides marinus]|jgi:uncharacterized membrane protein YgaE (UPF0421/DUF939 family)|uniref:Uncharacterized protein n=1 Tax=Myroides marinus TaxID=703342 RepID=A0A163X664_9FLAO|nr:hypothetical protein [Myroides marinus]MDR0195997.1 hypothetical protein [Myroides sp.]KUF44504.1 hypothetical protein AS361_15750 [Myroides marinus]KZE77368.1 hypothetical protein AV926_01155 [Myroides marinus]MDM1347018.1 hypothetical protein [Myroides marinus]MDM1351571.1 hypothetical protein [Myroides marinus]
MKNKTNWQRIGILTSTVLFLIVAITFEIFELSSLPAQFFGTLLGVVITAIITVLLLQGQTKSEESRERHLLVFEKKQEVFFQFLTQLNTILQRESLSPHLATSKKLEKEVNNLHDLIFEFGFLQMHTSAETFDKILTHVGNLMTESTQIKVAENQSVERVEKYYLTLTTDFFAIVSLLKHELYNEFSPHIDKAKLDRIIKLSF